MLFDCHRTVSVADVYQLKIKYDQDKFISMYHVIGLKQTRGMKNVTLKVAKKFAIQERVCGGKALTRILLAYLSIAKVA